MKQCIVVLLYRLHWLANLKQSLAVVRKLPSVKVSLSQP